MTQKELERKVLSLERRCCCADEILSFDSFGEFPSTGIEGRLYLDLATGDLYFWDGDSYESAGGSGGGLDAIPNLSTLINVSGAPAVPTAGHYSVYNVLDFGLVRDNTTDNTAAFIALLADLPDTGSSVYFPAGDYLFTNTINISKSINIYGDGRSSYPFFIIVNDPQRGATNLNFNSATADFISLGASVTNENPLVYIHDLSIINTSPTPPTDGAGIYMDDNVAHHTIDRVTIRGFHTNIQIYSASFVSINNCDIVSPYLYGIDLGNVAAVDAGIYSIINCKIVSGLHDTTTAIGIYYRGSGEVRIDQCDFTGQGVWDTPTQFKYPIQTTFELGATSLIQIRNNFFENYQEQAIYMRSVNGFTIYNIQISGNTFGPYNVGKEAHPAIDINGDFRTVILNDNIGINYEASTSYFIRCEGITKLHIGIGDQINWAGYDLLINCPGASHLIGGNIANTHVAYGTAANIIGGNSGFTYNGTDVGWTGKLVNSTFSTSSAELQVGSFYFQAYALNQSWLADNAYYTGAAYTRPVPGYVSAIEFNSGQVMFWGADTATGNFSPITTGKIDFAGRFGVGASLGAVLGTFTGATFFHNGATGRTGFGGELAPTALVHLSAGTNVAGTAPEKYTAGTLLSTIEPLAREVSANGLYQTNNSLNRYAEGGVIADFYTDVSNSGTSETDLYTYTTKANTLAVVGEKIECWYSGLFTDLTATSQLQIYFGGILLANTGALTVSATGGWSANVLIIRTGASTARSVVTINTPGASTALYTSQTDLTGLTFSNTQIIKITGTAGGASPNTGDIVAKLGSIWWYGASANS